MCKSARFVLFRLIKKRSINLLCVLDPPRKRMNGTTTARMAMMMVTLRVRMTTGITTMYWFSNRSPCPSKYQLPVNKGAGSAIRKAFASKPQKDT